MAGINYLKLHTPQEVKAVIRHCDKDERQKNTHSNKQIRKDLTPGNLQFDRGYAETCRLYDERIAYLDSLPWANVRKDRVTCCSLELPCPKELPDDRRIDWVNDVIRLLQQKYKSENIMNVYYHADEIHDYIDARTNEYTTSRAHIHVLIVPEIAGKLLCKEFSSRKNMKALNREVHEMTKNLYGVDFMDGTGRKSEEDMDALKNASVKALEAREDALRQKEVELDLKHQKREYGLNEREKKVEEREQAADNKDNELKNLEISLKKQKKEIEERDKQSQDIYNALSKAQKEKPEVKLAFERLQEHLRKQAKKDEEDEKSAENGGYSR